MFHAIYDSSGARAFVVDIFPISFRFMFAINQLEYILEETDSGSINYGKLKEKSN